MATTDPQPGPDGEAADDEPETGPLRRCAVTRERLVKERMIRFVVSPDRRLVPDVAARLPGRGIWLSARGDVLETARTKGAFARAARGPVSVPPDLLLVLQAALMRRIGDTLGLARRAGQAVCGFEKAREWLETGRASLVVQARDGSSEERARFMGAYAAGISVATPLDGASLGRVFGRDRTVHVAVAAGRLAETLTADCARLAGLDGVPAAAGPRARAAADSGTRTTAPGTAASAAAGESSFRMQAGR